jgi:hypothetical protein
MIPWRRPRRRVRNALDEDGLLISAFLAPRGQSRQLRTRDPDGRDPALAVLNGETVQKTDGGQDVSVRLDHDSVVAENLHEERAQRTRRERPVRVCQHVGAALRGARRSEEQRSCGRSNLCSRCSNFLPTGVTIASLCSGFGFAPRMTTASPPSPRNPRSRTAGGRDRAGSAPARPPDPLLPMPP